MRCILVMWLIVAAGIAFATEPSTVPVQQEKHSAVARMDYLLFLPQGYAESQQRWPLMLFLHGAAESGTNLASVKRHGPPHIVEARADFPFILVSPQSRGGWNNPALTALLDDVIGHYRVDAHRIYVTGLSMGGFATWSLAAAHPERFAAIVPMSAGGDPADAKKLAALPIWVFHGARDAIVPVQRSRDMVEAIKAAGGNIRYTEYPRGRHNCWAKAYNDPELYKWLLEQKR